MIPVFILQTWLSGLLSLGIIGGGIYLWYRWVQDSWVWDTTRQVYFFSPNFGWNDHTALFGFLLVLTLIAIGGAFLLRLLLRISGGKKEERDPNLSPQPDSRKVIFRTDGTKLNVEMYGPEDGIPIILTHGWGMDSRAWNYLKRELTSPFRLLVWDEAGLGKSSPPANNNYNLEKMAGDLDAVIQLSGSRPVILLGHSIGGMIALTYCRLFPEKMKSRVSGLILTHTTPINPVRTVAGGKFFTSIEKPVLVPMMKLAIILSPLLWITNWLSYFNGSSHLFTKITCFGGTETWQEIDFATRFQAKASPAVLARGMLAMMKYDATRILPEICIRTLVVAGDRDPVTKPSASGILCTTIPKSRLLILSPGKHLGMIEHTEQYAEAIRIFVAEVEFHEVSQV